MGQQQPEIVDDIRWKHPSTIMIGGPSGSGKTELTSSILANKDYLFNPPPQKNNIILPRMAECVRELETIRSAIRIATLEVRIYIRLC